MLRKILALLVLLNLAVSLPAFAADEAGEAISGAGLDVFMPDYVIGPGDVLFISVWKNQELTKQLPVLPDGKLSYPLIGELRAGGMSVGALEKNLRSELGKYISDPILSVSVLQVNSMLIYIIGKVNNPGHFPLSSNVNVLQALAMAKGLNPFAKKDEIKIFRNVGTTTRIYDFRYDEVASGENLQQNIMLERGDIIVVP
jgi:polysaccharide export outer membrane protein